LVVTERLRQLPLCHLNHLQMELLLMPLHLPQLTLAVVVQRP
jgi:hypothetical protein